MAASGTYTWGHAEKIDKTHFFNFVANGFMGGGGGGGAGAVLVD